MPRFMVMVKATPDSESGVMPSERAARRDGRVQRGAREGRRDAGGRGPAPQREGRPRPLLRQRRAPSSTGRSRRRRSWSPATGSSRRSRSRSASSGSSAVPNPMTGDSEIEIRQVFEAEDFGEEYTPELREQRGAHARAGAAERGLTRGCPGAPTTRDVQRTIDAVWRIESAAADRRAHAHGARRRARRGPGAGRARGGAGDVAASRASRTTRAPGSWPRRSAARSTCCAAARRSHASRSRSARELELNLASAPEDPATVALSDARQVGDDLLRPDVHVLPPGARRGGARGADAAAARRADDERDRARVPHAGADASRSGSCARSAR